MTSRELARLKWQLKRGPKLTRQGRAEYLKQLIQQTKGSRRGVAGISALKFELARGLRGGESGLAPPHSTQIPPAQKGNSR